MERAKSQKINIDCETFDKVNIIYAENTVLFNARAVFGLLQIAERSGRDLVSKMQGIKYTFKHKPIGSNDAITVLTIDGIRWIFESDRRAFHVSNRKEVVDYFVKIYDEFLINKQNIYKDTITQPIDMSPGSKIYLIQICEGIYKFGETDNIERRLREHRVEFDFKRVEKIFHCLSKTASQNVEKQIKENLKKSGYLVEYPSKNDATKKHLEVFKYCDNIGIIIHMIDDLVREYNLKATSEDEKYYSLATEIKKHQLIELECNNKKNENNIDLMRYQLVHEENHALYKLINELRLENENLKELIRCHETRISRLEENKTQPTIENVIIERPVNRPTPKIDIDLLALTEFVRRSFKLSIGYKIGKGTLESRFQTTIYNQYFINSESTRDFFTTLYACLETIFGTSPKQIFEGEYSKDFIYNYELVCVDINEFIDAKCNRVEGSSENPSIIHDEYEIYCREKNSFGYGNDFPNTMKENFGYTLTHTSIGDRYRGIYLKINIVNKFIQEKCTVGGAETRCTQTQFMDHFNLYLNSQGIKKSQGYDKSSAMKILEEEGFEVVSLDGGCIDIIGLTVTGFPYPRKRKPTKKQIKVKY